ncbi:MAG: ABC transporter permease [Candidatus Acidiferrales bacterium]
MSILRNVSTGLRTLLRKQQANQELDEELRAFLEAAVAEKMKDGLSRRQALRAARIEMGSFDAVKENVRAAGWESIFDGLWQDIRYGVRMLQKSPGFTAVAILTLALGIGANTAIFSLVAAALMRPLPVSDPQNLLLMAWHARAEPKDSSYSNYGDCRGGHRQPAIEGCSFSEPLFNEIRSQTNVFSRLAAFAGARGLDLSGNGPANTVEGAEYVTGEYFETLGVQPLVGRLIASADDAPSASPVVVLSYSYWKTYFGGSPSAVGKTILLNRVPFTIIGVAEQKFDALSPGNTIQLWLPLSVAPRIELPWDNRDANARNWWLVFVGRLKPGVTRAQAQAVVNELVRNETTQGAKPLWGNEDNASIALVGAQQGLTGDTNEIAAPLYVLMMAVGVVLLIACANVAGLLLSRAAARQKEIALRFALGAGRFRVLRQLLTESVLLSVAGGALGILLANWVVEAIASFITANQDGPIPFNPTIDARVLAFTAGISILTGILFGMAPAMRGLQVDLMPTLKDASGRGTLSTNPRARWLSAGNALAVAQVALTVVVLVGAGLLVRTLRNLKTINPGFDTRNVLTFNLDPTLIGYKRADVDNFYRDFQSRLAAMPGVMSVSYSWRALLGGGLWTTSFHLPDTPKDAEVRSDVLPVGSGFFQTMRIRFQLGREFNSADFATARRVAEVLAAQEERVAASVKQATKSLADVNKSAAADLPLLPAIVNEAFVRKYYPKQNPIGIRFGSSVADESSPSSDPGWEIVGVVADAKYNRLRREVEPTFYVPKSGGSVSFALRTATNPASFVPQIRSVVGQMDADLPVSRIRTESQQIDNQLLAERLIARLSSFFGILALLLACIGLYGLLAYEVSRRTREIGIRIALGARRADVLRLVIGQGLTLAAAGAVVGVSAALGLTRFLGSLLYGVRPADPLTFAGVAVLLASVAALACYLPARRAMRVDPLVALRYE